MVCATATCLKERFFWHRADSLREFLFYRIFSILGGHTNPSSTGRTNPSSAGRTNPSSAGRTNPSSAGKPTLVGPVNQP